LVATPTCGGPDAASALELLEGLAGLRIVSADINTVSPPHDVGGMTATLAGLVMLIDPEPHLSRPERSLTGETHWSGS
jgi:agmatinase